jgi:hypothetical protein
MKTSMGLLLQEMTAKCETDEGGGRKLDVLKLMLTLVTRDTIPHGLRTGYVSGPVSQYFSQVPLEKWIKYFTSSFSVAEVFWFCYLMETTAAGRMAFFNVSYLERNCSRTLRLRFLRLKFVH